MTENTHQSRLIQQDQGAIENATPEDKTKNELTEWLTDHGCTVFWDEINPWKFPTFKTVGGNERPDLIIPDAPIAHSSEKTRVLALEVKPEGGSDVCDGFHQTTRYWRRAVNGNAEYEISDSIVEPSVYALATETSPVGKLFDDDQLRTEWGSSLRQREKGYLPKEEHAGTGMAFRTALRWVTEYCQKHPKASEDIGFGALLSSRLDGDDTNRPAVMFWERNSHLMNQTDCWRIM